MFVVLEIESKALYVLDKKGTVLKMQQSTFLGLIMELRMRPSKTMRVLFWVLVFGFVSYEEESHYVNQVDL